jgi:hypothetical protein
MPAKKMKKRHRSALPSLKTRYGFAAHIRYVFEEGAKYHGREVAQDLE